MQGPTTVVWYDLKLRGHAVCLGVTGERQGGKGFVWGGGRGHDTYDDRVGQRESYGEHFLACSLLGRVLGMVLSLETHLRFGFGWIYLAWFVGGWKGPNTYAAGGVKGPGVKLGAQMFDRTGRCTPYTLHHLQGGDVYDHIKYLSSSGLGGCAPPF